MKLSEIKSGDAVIEEITAPRETLLKLSRMGVVRGAVVTVLRKGIKGNPIEIKILGYRLALSKSVADKIGVKIG